MQPLPDYFKNYKLERSLYDGSNVKVAVFRNDTHYICVKEVHLSKYPQFVSYSKLVLSSLRIKGMSRTG